MGGLHKSVSGSGGVGLPRLNMLPKFPHGKMDKGTSTFVQQVHHKQESLNSVVFHNILAPFLECDCGPWIMGLLSPYKRALLMGILYQTNWIQH